MSKLEQVYRPDSKYFIGDEPSKAKWTLYQAFCSGLFVASFGLLAACVVSDLSPIELIEQVIK